MQINGLIKKMHTHLNINMVQYQLPIGSKLLNMNDLVGEQIILQFNGEIVCSNCKKHTNKIYSQGFCYSCCQSLARCDLCIVKPETCHHHLGTCREPEWGLNNCFNPHIVYLANSSGIKVGITRRSNIPNRWIDQGANSALPILEIDNRLKSGKIEVALKKYVNDRTNWRKMLKNEIEQTNLKKINNNLLKKIPHLISDFSAIVLDNEVLTINYPVVKYPNKISSLNFEKTPKIKGILQGIKGQYLLLNTGVLNIRKFSSHHITIIY